MNHQLRLSLLALAGALGLASSAHAASAPISGYLGLNMGISSQPTDLDTGSDPFGNVFAFGSQGAVNAWLMPGLSVQFSAQAEGTSGYRYSNSDDSDARFGGVSGVNLDWRSSSAGSFGVFAGFTGTNNDDYCAGNGGALGGAEAQGMFGSTVLYGQIGVGQQFNNPDCGMLDKYWLATAEIRHFVNPNLRISANLGIAKGIGQVTSGTAPDLSVLQWGAGVENQFNNSPFSVGINYAGERIKGEGSLTQNSVLVSLTMNFGEPTLAARQADGAAFSLPNFTRGMFWSCSAAFNGC